MSVRNVRRTSQGLGFFLPFRNSFSSESLFRDSGSVRHQAKSKILGREVWERAAIRKIQILDVAASAVFCTGLRPGCLCHRESAGVMDTSSHGTDMYRPARRKTT